VSNDITEPNDATLKRLQTHCGEQKHIRERAGELGERNLAAEIGREHQLFQRNHFNATRRATRAARNPPPIMAPIATGNKT
jgi:hypothetical protein